MTPAITLQPLQTWWAARNPRERLMLLGASMAALLLAADAALTVPLEKRLKRDSAELHTQRARLEAARPLAASSGADDTDAPQRRAQEQRLRARLAGAQAALQALEQRAGEAARLPEMLRAITATVGSVQVLALDLGDDASAPAAAATTAVTSGGRRVYRLPITLKVSGSYGELQTLLAQVEHHAAALQWSSLALDAAQWPAVQLTLKAHVPSLTPRWSSQP